VLFGRTSTGIGRCCRLWVIDEAHDRANPEAAARKLIELAALLFFGLIFRYCALQFGGENLITSYQCSKEIAPYLALCFPLEALAFGNLRVERSQVRL
jgi:hypothetical protein